jgi:hypothetical protein
MELEHAVTVAIDYLTSRRRPFVAVAYNARTVCACPQY